LHLKSYCRVSDILPKETFKTVACATLHLKSYCRVSDILPKENFKTLLLDVPSKKLLTNPLGKYEHGSCKTP
jgi:hypothetical protein